MRVGISLPVQEELGADVHLRIALAAEEAGFDVVSFGEIAGPEAFSLLGAIAGRTDRIGLMTGIVSSFTRSPALVAMACATLDDIAPGRVTLGLGASTKMIADDWHDRPFELPLTRTREFIDAFRRIVAGERVSFHGRSIDVERFRLMPPEHHDVPVLIGAINPKALIASGEVADGVLLAFCPVDELAGRAALVREGAERAGRDPDELTIAVNVNAYAGPRAAESLERNREFVLAYASLPTHRHSFGEALGPAVFEPLARGDRAEALRNVPDEAVHRICAIGTGEHVARRIEQYHEAGADLVSLHVLGTGRGDGDSPFDTIREVSRALGRSS